MATKALAVIAGVGPGTGASIARRFAKAYSVVVLSRNPANFEPLVQEINSSGGQALGISADVTDSTSVKSAFEKIAQQKGAFNFAKSALPLLLQAQGLQHPPTLIFTGATASVKGSANFAAFATGKFALRALAQSLAREFGPKGVHVSHVIIDGVIDIPRTKAWTFEHEDAKLDPDAIAESYWHLHTQPRTTFGFELDLRPYVEKW
ncbi:hypothetical protein KXX33_001123 [Aspergillus fumigatus]|nr:hypothetical protein KXX45_001713 [Aspergillus fumigatus]KAH1349387.1 hypothetical protein KXX33_001123 [Aspergillus fumigatus]KAH2557287.1 hypothetical protein KXW48_008015 [Aspergillus fumigatus]KAH2684193.1 hypothetical protein KXW53_002097 [Aspergillus fumigatus]